jgi:dTDP-4-dehydrorhamnose reductase
MLLITGGTGRLGRELGKVFPDAVRPPRRELDLQLPETVDGCLRALRPSTVIHAAAYTDVRGAERERATCWDTNVRGTERLVEALRRVNPSCYFVYVSTACVFFGDGGPYTEDDVPRPKNFYGLTKLVGEAIAGRLSASLVVRTNFVAREPWPYPRAFVDRYGTYLFADDVARALRDLMERRLTGLVHVAGDRRLSMLELAHLTTPTVEPMTMAEVSLPLTVDMTLRSARIAPYQLTVA